MIGAVRNEVEELTEKITRLEELIAKLQKENEYFRKHSEKELLEKFENRDKKVD